MKNAYRRLGVFGGTFNPIHFGHLRLAEDVREEFCLHKVLFIPTNKPPHKKIIDSTNPSHRLKMVKLAIESNNHFLCEDIEIKRGGKSFTIDTVNYIYEKFYFEDKPYFIIGSDLALEIDTWKDIDLLFDKIHFIILIRDGYPMPGNNLLQTKEHEIICECFEKRKIDITSSEVRKRVKERKSIRYLVPDEVLRYIKEKKLYG